ncbi:expressed unknown protein [Seminavis robusta]|uniref:Uncharacterized protein n=1 Tax=Seminavis robusta TaxID=568900 RepID=A0A9N8EG19_9STRA|nr:expressed unknown protein [Seminavis robusta]|eukprot:Sro945_g223140.1 n/a (580) ;mRNA; f:26082-28427
MNSAIIHWITILYSGLFLLANAQSTSTVGLLEELGNDGEPSSFFPLDLCKGDCDDDDECSGSMVCFQRNGNEQVPGCRGTAETGTDYCIIPPNFRPPVAATTLPPTPPPTQNPTSKPNPSPVNPPTTNSTIAPAPNLTQNPTPNPVAPSPNPTPNPTFQPTQNPTPNPTNAPVAVLMIVGNDGSPSSAFPLSRCEGDCDDDGECQGSLTCFQRSGNEPVPGCVGIAESESDYCIQPQPTPQPTPIPTFSPVNLPANQLLEVGNDGDPPGVFPLQECRGDCDDDGECQGSLTCFQRSGNEPVPGCVGIAESESDYCIQPQPTPQPTPIPTFSPINLPANQLLEVGNDGEPTGVFPLQECRGDCDDDSECQGNLVCLQRSGNEPVPGCVGTAESGSDYCIQPQPTPNPTPQPTPQPFDLGGGNVFKIKLYWEEGYYWQEERFERKWCAAYNYDRSYCWYGDDWDDCEDDELYIDDCDDHYDFDHRFVEVGNDEVLIRLAYEDRCWQRSGSRIYLRPCDSGNSNQRWITLGGCFGCDRFELSQRGLDNRCVSNDHHPKSREVVEMHTCDGSRDSDTSYWNRY